MGIVDWTGVAQDIGGRWSATREGLILFGKWGHRKGKIKEEASATAITHKPIKENDKLLSKSDLQYTLARWQWMWQRNPKYVCRRLKTLSN